MSKNLLQVLFLAIVISSVLMPAAAEEIKASDGMVILKGDQLTQSITTFKKGEWGPIKTIIKLYEGNQRAPGYRFYLNTYGNLPDFDDMSRLSSAPTHTFLIPIPILDDAKALDNEELLDGLAAEKPPVYDSNFIECSMNKFMLINKNNTTYLMLANKDTTDASAAPHTIKLYKLVSDPDVYFLKTAERKTEVPVCDPADVYRRMEAFAMAEIK